jgi:very-short-patch-repair endonuclease
MSFCKLCNEQIDIHTLSQQRRNGICQKCAEQYRYCHSCKMHKLKSEFRSRTKNCINCYIETKKQRKNKPTIQRIECTKCHKIIQLKSHRLIKFSNKYACNECKNGITDDLVKCKFCKKEFEILTPNHIENCSSRFSGNFGSCKRKKMTYNEYLEKYGWDSVYSARYRKKMKQLSTEACTNEVKEKIREKSQEWWQNQDNKKQLSASLKIAQNTEKAKENHKQGMLNYFKRLSSKELKIKKKKSQEIAFSTVFPIISKPAMKVFNKLKEYDILSELEYGFDFYHIDIAIVKYKIAIEIDGDYWHGNPLIYKQLSSRQRAKQAKDKSKTTYLINRNWKVLRFWEYDIKHNLELCVNSILQNIKDCKESERIIAYA